MATKGRGDPSKAAQLTRNFGLSTLVVLIVGILSQVMGWVATKWFLLHITGDSVAVNLLGTATFYILVASLIATLGDLRLGSAYTFFVARGGKVEALTGTYLLWRVFALGVLGSGLVLVNSLIPGGLSGFTSTETALALFVLFPILEIPSILYSTLQTARGRTIYGQVPLVVEMSIRLGLLLYVATQFNSTNIATVAGAHAFVTDIAWAYVIGAAAGAVASAPLFRHITFRGIYPELKDMFTFATPLMGAMFITYAITSLPPLLFNYLSGPSSKELLQYFSSANAFLILLMFLPNAVIVPLFPDIASLHVQDRMGEIRSRTRRALRYTVIILAPSIVAIAVFRYDFLQILYTNSFAVNASLAVAIFAFTALPLSVGRVMGTVLDAVGQQKRELYLSTAQIISLIAALVLLVPPYGVAGGAAAVAISSVTGLVMNGWYLHRYVNVHVSARPFFFVFLAASVTFAMFSNTILRFVHLSLPVQEWYVLIPVVLVGQAVYVVVLAMVGELTKEDVVVLAGSAGLPPSVGRLVSRICWRASWPDPDASPLTPSST